MSRKYFNKKRIKSNIDKTIDFHKLIDSVIVENKDYREIFDDAVQFKYGECLNEYYENDINAIMVNNIRHNCSNYDQLFKQMHMIHRSNMDYHQYKNCTLEKISNAYPFLKDECKRQKCKFNMVEIVN